MKYLKFLFTERNSIIYLIKILLVIGFLAFNIQLIYQGADPLTDWLMPLFLIIIFVAYLILNYFNYLKYYICQNKLLNIKVAFRHGECLAEIFQRPKKTIPAMKNDIVYIKIPSRKIKCNYILTSNSFIVFCTIVTFGIFKTVMNPILIKLNKNHVNYLNIKKSRIISFDDTHYEETSLVIPFKKNIKELEKLNIIDFKEILSQLPYKKKA